MQNDDGGWGAFDKNQSYKKLGRIPPYHEEYGHELKDPSTADVTAHVLQTLGENKVYSSEKIIKKVTRWFKRDQLSFGGWWGRWGLCYIYGTTQVLLSLSTIGEDVNKSYVKDAIGWLINIQNDDGGWGEHYSSYYSEKPIIGESTVEQMSWVLISLMECGITDLKIIEKGITFLLERQKSDGSFPKAYTAAAIDPGKYEIYSLVFPLMALSKYKKRCKP
jgi:squalene-hopene/tetraprenyl-beta-curcumene cyclase